MPKKLVHADGCVCGRCYRQQKNRQYRDRQANGTTKEKDWMDKRAEVIWQAHVEAMKKEGFRFGQTSKGATISLGFDWGRSPLCDM